MGRWMEMRGRIIEETIEPVRAPKLNGEMNSKGVAPGHLHKRGHYNKSPAANFLRLAPGVGASGRAPRDRSCARR
jgi:hypothetical protein